MSKVPETLLMCFIAADTAREATIVSTCQSSLWTDPEGNQYPANNLLNGKGLNGKFDGDNCAHTNNGHNQWISFELENPENLLFSIQITPRLSQPQSIPWLKRRSQNLYDSTPWLKRRSRNISVTIGPSESYNSTEPLCLPVFDLVMQERLYEYRCTGELHQGKYVKITRIGNGIDGIVNICEVKIFTVRGDQIFWVPS